MEPANNSSSLSSAAAVEPQGTHETAGNARWPNRDQVAVLMTQSPPLVPHFTLVRFNIKANLKPGETLAMTGSAAELGAWKVNKFVPMKPKDGHEGVYELTIELPTAAPFEYKYLVLKKKQVLRWETIIGNRFLSAGVYNVARGKPATQISTSEKSCAANAVNGSVFGKGRRYISRTLEQQDPWWEVDMKENVDIDSIVVWQRESFRETKKGGCAPFWLFVFDGDRKDGPSSIEEAKTKAIASYRFSENQRRNVCDFNPSIRGRYVRIQSEGVLSLELAEVQVFAVATSEFVRTKGGVFTRETSTYSILKNDREKLVLHEVDDGSFGVDPSPNLEHRDAEEGVDAAKKFEQKMWVDEEWVCPMYGPELHLTFGTRTDKSSPIQVFGETTAPIGYKLVAHCCGKVFQSGKEDEPLIHSRCVTWIPDDPNNPAVGKMQCGDILRSSTSMQVITIGIATMLEHPDSLVRIDVTEVFEDREELLGCACIMASNFAVTSGKLNVPILSKSCSGIPTIVGELFGAFLVVTPFSHPENNLSEVWRTYWITRPSLDVGHRGVGRSFKSAPGFRKSVIRENTTLSFITAGRYSADFVEFDVQLSKDRVPVIYHDFELLVGVNEEVTEAEDKLLIGVHDLTLAQLQSVRLSPAIIVKEAKLKKLMKKHWERILHLTNSPQISTKNKKKAPKLAAFLEQLPTLRDLFKFVPKHIGFDVEVKYPVALKHKHLYQLPEFEMNAFVDGVLQCVFDNADNRRVVFSCFQPDICVLLRAKQAKYPVLFLTCGDEDKDDSYEDRRCTSVINSLLCAKLGRMQGICSNSAPFLKDPQLISAVKSQGMLLFTWGDANTDTKLVEIQRKHGVDGVISDNIGDVTKAIGKTKSVFED